MIQAVVRRSVIVRMLGDDRWRTLAISAGLGAALSSCSYAAVALARSLLRKGASFAAAMAFEIASTNLVIELGMILALLMGWQFTLAEFAGRTAGAADRPGGGNAQLRLLNRHAAGGGAVEGRHQLRCDHHHGGDNGGHSAQHGHDGRRHQREAADPGPARQPGDAPRPSG